MRTGSIWNSNLHVVGIGLLATSPVSAQWPHQVEDELLATSTDTFAGSPWVAADGAGGAFLAWDDNRNSALTGRDVYLQHFDSAGAPQWTSDGVAVVAAAGAQVDPVVISAGGGSCYVIWSDSRLPSSPRIYAQRFNSAGVPQWAPNGIRVGTNAFSQTGAAVAGDSAGNLFVAWLEAANDSRTFAQKFDATGNRLWGAAGLEFSSGVSGGGMVVSIVPDGAGGAVLGWIQFGDDPRKVWVRRILADGTPAFPAVDFGADSNALGNLLAMVPDGTGGAIVGWQGDNGADDSLFLYRVDGGGNRSWGAASLPLVSQPGKQDALVLVPDGSGGVFAAWQDPRTGSNDVYVQRIDESGATVFQPDGIPVGQTPHERRLPRLAGDGAGGAIVVYQRDQDGLYAQKISASGVGMWGGEGVPVTDNDAVTEPQLTPDSTGGGIVSIIAFSNGNRPALKRILASGRLTEARLANISTRAFVGSGVAQAIPGFVVNGGQAKTLLIRAIGPTLGGFGVTGALADPTLKLFDGDDREIAAQNDWGQDPAASLIASVSTQVGAFTLSASSLDSALVRSLPVSRYTTGVVGADGGSGVALLEVYDADPAGQPGYLANLSSRVFVGTGEQQAIPGFVIAGDGMLTLLIRAIGPTLGDFGVTGLLDDPILTLFDSADAAITSNDDWADAGTDERIRISDTAARIGAFALASNSRDSALLVTLPAGRYTASAVGAGGGTGICLIEIYVVP